MRIETPPSAMIERVGRTSVSERQAALLHFLESWHPSLAPPARFTPPSGCPPMLAWWHSLVLANPGLAGAQNHFVAPELVGVDPFIRYRGATVEALQARSLWFFHHENQGVVSWACESGDDPVVWARCDWPPTYSDAWSPESEPLSGFLVGAVLLEAMYGAEYGGAWTTMKRADFGTIPGVANIGLTASSAPNDPLQFWSAPGFVAVTAPSGIPDSVRVMFGARSPDALEEIGELVEDPYDAGLWQ